MPIAVGHYVVAQNVIFRGFRPFRNALVVVSINKRVKVRNPDQPTSKSMLLWPNEILGYYEDRAEADRAAGTAHSVWQAYEDQIERLKVEQAAATRLAGKTGETP